MSKDKDLADEFEDEFEVDFDDDENDDDGESGAPAVADEPKKEEEIPDIDKVDEEKERLREETVKLRADNERLSTEKRSALEESRNAKKAVLEGDITQWKREMDNDKAEWLDLKDQLIRAQMDGDADTATKLNRKISEKEVNYNQLQTNINGHYHQLNTLPSVPIEEVKKPVAEEKEQVPEAMKKWGQKNSWLDDPMFSEKKDKAFAIYDDLKKKGYHPSNPKFWTAMDNRLVESTVEKKHSVPPVKPLGSSNPGTNTMSVKKKGDKAIIEKVNQFIQMSNKSPENMDPVKFKQYRQDVYKSIAKQEAAKNASA